MNTKSLSDEGLQQLVDQYPWFHTIQLRPGVVTKGKKTSTLLELEKKSILDDISLRGKSVLDIGAWNGFWTVNAQKAGAKFIMAMDSPTWIHPNFRGKETYDIVCEELGINAFGMVHDVQKPFPTMPEFDVVLFLGVLYHLKNPIDVFSQLYRITKEVLVLETAQDAHEIDRPAMVFYPGKELSNDATNWWGPNTKCVYCLLKDAGFKTIYYMDHPMYGKKRGIFHAYPLPDVKLSSESMDWINLTQKYG